MLYVNEQAKGDNDNTSVIKKKDHIVQQMDFLRAFAIICVVVIHSSGRYAKSDVEHLIDGWLSIVTRPCIAIFLFISGYLLAGRLFDFSELRRRVWRVAIPYVLFSIPASLYIYKTSIYLNIKSVLISFVLGRSFGIYWFVFVILYVYLVHFVCCKLQLSSMRVLALFAVITIIHNLFYRQFLSIIEADAHNGFPSVYQYRYVFWPVFFYMGVFFHERNMIDVIRAKRILVIMCWLAVFAFYNYSFFSEPQGLDPYNSITGSVYSATTIIALLAMKLSWTILGYLSRISYYLYFTHIFIVYVLYDGVRYIGYSPPFLFYVASIVTSVAVPISVFQLTSKYLPRKLFWYLGIGEVRRREMH